MILVTDAPSEEGWYTGYVAQSATSERRERREFITAMYKFMDRKCHQHTQSETNRGKVEWGKETEYRV